MLKHIKIFFLKIVFLIYLAIPQKKISINLDELSELNIVDLLKLIIMVSPFEVSVKQMFLELKSNKDLYENVLSALQIELASKEESTSIN